MINDYNQLTQEINKMKHERSRLDRLIRIYEERKMRLTYENRDIFIYDNISDNKKTWVQPATRFI